MPVHVSFNAFSVTFLQVDDGWGILLACVIIVVTAKYLFTPTSNPRPPVRNVSTQTDRYEILLTDFANTKPFKNY